MRTPPRMPSHAPCTIVRLTHYAVDYGDCIAMMRAMRWWICLMVVAGCTESDSATVTCGEGTMLQDEMCVGAGGLSCGTGTHEVDGLCVPDGSSTYEVRVYSSDVSADGHTKTPVLVIGTKPDGTPATDRIVLNTDRPGAGQFVDPSPVVGPLGTTAYFVPCNATTPGCTGPLRLTLALADDPSTVLAGVDINLIEPSGVANTAPCMVASKAMYFDGNDYIYNGTLTVTQAVWSDNAATNSIAIHLDPSGQSQGLWWDLDFDSRQLGTDLLPGVYEMAERAPFASPDHPGLEVTGDGRGCNTLTGRFQVHYFELAPGNMKIQRALVSFEQHCEGGTNMLSGCVRYDP